MVERFTADVETLATWWDVKPVMLEYVQPRIPRLYPLTNAHQKFIDAVSTTIQPRDITLASPAPSEVLSSESLDQINHAFITGISLCGAVIPAKFLTLFVSIPYLGIGNTITSSGSRTLKQHRLRERFQAPVEPLEDQVLVHQIWFLVFDNSSFSPPPLPFQ